MADEAYALHGSTPVQTYLDIGKIIAIAARAGADAVHPGYGFLAENAAFASTVIEAGLVWIGPPPAAIEALGDKVKARDIARRVGAPLAPGTDAPVRSAEEIKDFAARYGLLAAKKAPEAGRGGSGPVPFRRAEQAALHRVEGDPPRGGLCRGRYLRVSGRRRRHDQLPRGEHQASGRAPGV